MNHNPIYVVGHKNPDTDSICAAIAYAELLRAQGQAAVPVRQGELWPQTRWLLQRFAVPEPSLLRDVKTRVGDLMTAPALTARPETPLLEVGQLMRERSIRALPVVDEGERLVGLVAVEDFATILLEGLDPQLLDKVPLELGNIVRVLGGTVLVAGNRPLRDKVLVGAMRVASMQSRLEPGALIVLGDREEAQQAAIAGGVGAIIVTGGLPVSEAILDLARQRQVTVISVPHHTFTTVRLLNMSIPVGHIVRRGVPTIAPDDLVDEVKRLLTRERTLPVLDETGRVLGVLSRSDLLKPVRRRLVLVDHNERAQAIEGLEEAEIVGIIDHHRLADIQTAQPIFMRVEPVGCTCTILHELYVAAGVAVPAPIAGLLLGAILADTVLFRSPTGTPRDRQAAEALARVAGVDMATFGQELLAAGSELAGKSAEELLSGDFKEFTLRVGQDSILSYGVASLETINAAAVAARREELLAAMRARQERRGYTALLLMILDIPHEQTEILVVGQEQRLAEAFGQPLVDGCLLRFPGILSRKQQVVPVLARMAG
jgi:manganese-dependent inorganic pyrophosphatase